MGRKRAMIFPSRFLATFACVVCRKIRGKGRAYRATVGEVGPIQLAKPLERSLRAPLEIGVARNYNKTTSRGNIIVKSRLRNAEA